MKPGARLGLLIWLFVSVPAGAATIDDLPANADYNVRSIRVEGAKHVSASQIRGVMATQLPPWYKPWKRWFTNVEFYPAVFRADLDRVKTLLRESGYFEARVSHEIEANKDKIDITLHIHEGKLTKVKQIDLVAADFALPPEDEATLRTKMPLRPEQAFAQKAYDDSRSRVERFYLEQSFAYVQVAKAATVDTATHEAHVTYTITRSEPAVFGQTTIDGLQKLDEKLLRREITYEAGTPYDPRKIEKTQAKIFGLELFRSVTMEPANLPEHTGTVDIAIHAAEGPPRSIKVGVGYDLEEQLRAQLQWQHNNFLGGGRQLGVRLAASFITQSIQGEFRQPYFLSPKQTLIVPLTQERDDEPGFTVTRSRLAPRIERKLLADLTASLGYNFEYDDLTKVPDETKAQLEEFTGHGFVSSLIFTIERNTTVDQLDPHEGSILNLTIEQAGGPWQGDFDFYRGVFEAKKYFPVLRDQVIATRFRMGAADGYDGTKDVPMFRRFFAGGLNSTRGYDRHKLGPLTKDEDPIGGRSLIEGSIEARTPVYGNLGAVVFFDAGAVDEQAFRYDSGDLEYGVGPGIRYNTPVGPLRLDIGFPLNAPSGLPRWQIHFSVGQAF